MARTKQAAGKGTGGKAPRKNISGSGKAARKSAMVAEKSSQAGKTTSSVRRFRAGTHAAREIKKYSKSTELLLRRLPFQRMCRGLVSSATVGYRFTKTSLEATQEALEMFLVTIMEDALQCAMHAKRVTLMAKDLDLVVRLKYEKHIKLSEANK